MRMRLCLIAVLALLTACQMTLPGKPLAPPPGNPITTGEISVTALDAPAAGDAAPDVAAVPAPEVAAAPEPAVTPETAEPAAQPAPVVKSAGQIACEKRNGTWVSVGRTSTMTCRMQLRDGGQQCSRDRDCEGQCLARSRSCAPYAPLFGCNEVLQDNGQRVTLCIE